MGTLYEEGKIVEQSYKEAVYWYKKAIENGDIDAKYNLGRCYYSDRSSKENLKKASEIFKELSEQNYKDSKSYLRKCFLKNLFS